MALSGLTEPNAGTDANNQTTTAVKEGDHWVLNGSKIFITNAGPANVYFVIAVTGRNPKGVECAAFIVEKGFPGFSVGKKELKMGIRGSSTCELIFENCIVPEANLVGKIGEGVKMALKTLDGGRVGISAQALRHDRGRVGSHRRIRQGKKAVQQAYFGIPKHSVLPCRPVHQDKRRVFAG